MFPPETKWEPPSLDSLPEWAEAERVAIDVETRDPYLMDLGIGVRREGYIVGISFAIEDGPSHYLPIRHQGGDNLDEDQVLSYLRDQAASFRGEIVGANLSYDIDYLLEEGIQFHPRYFRDVQIAAPLINELEYSYSLAKISERLGLPGKDETVLREAAQAYGVDPKGGLWQLPARYVGAYAEGDVTLPLQILRRQERLLSEQSLWDIFNLESKVLPVLVKMRRRGVLIDQDKLTQIEEWSVKEETEALKIVQTQSGVQLGLDKVFNARHVAAVLKAVDIHVGSTTTGQPNVDKEMLVAAKHPVASAILRARKVNKLRTTFAKSVRRYMTNGRIHTTFLQISSVTEGGSQKGARYGRLSSVDLNVQQQPSRDEWAAMWRAIYIPEPGSLWACCDYALQEPRWTTHWAAKLKLPMALETVDRFRNDPLFDCHQFMADLTGWARKEAKMIFLGLCYGEGGAKLCGQLGLPTRWALSIGKERKIIYYEHKKDALKESNNHEIKFMWLAAGEEGQKILTKFDEYMPFVNILAMKAKKAVQKQGYITTVGGRRLHFRRDEETGKYEGIHKALNRLVQGSSADQTKAAMVLVDKEVPDFFMQLQIHDELDGSVTEPSIAHKVSDLMCDSMSALLPFKVDVEIGPSWGEIK